MTDRFVINNSSQGEEDETSLSLLHRARENDQEAWFRLVDLYAGAIYVRCRSKWKLPASDAQLLAQDVLTLVASNLGDFQRQRKGSFRKWIQTITDNRCMDHIRKLQRDKPKSAKGGSDSFRVLDQIPDPGTIPSDPEGDADYQKGEFALIVRQAIKAIRPEVSERDWTIFWQVFVRGRKGKCVAEEMGVTDNVVYLACSRIKKKFKAVYQDLIDDEMLGDGDGKPWE